MAKFNHGIFSKAKNKLGGVTFQQYEGMQIGKEYQPNVKNPQTANQVRVRAIFKVASQFTAIWWNVLAHLVYGSTYERFKRGEALRIIRSLTNWGVDTNTAYIDVTTTLSALEQGRVTSPVSLSMNHSGQNIMATSSQTEANSMFYGKVIAVANDGKILAQRDTIVSMAAGEALVLNPALPSGVIPRAYQAMGIMIHANTEAGRALFAEMTATGTTIPTNQFNVAVSRAVAAGDMLVTNVAYDYLEI